MRLLTCGLLLAAVALSGCTGGAEPQAAPTGTAGSGGASATPTPSAPPTATAPPAPRSGACHRLSYAQALAPTTTGTPVSCKAAHTSETYAVGRLTTAVGGHLVAVDSPRVQRQVQSACPRRLADFVGGSAEDRRLAMLRAVWFTPSVDASDAGADWYRCDVITVAGDKALGTLKGSLKGILDTSGSRRDEVAMCGTADPGSASFRRVTCGARHSWRALRTVDLGGRAYPGSAAAREAGQSPCQQAGQDVAADSLDYRWGYEWPTKKQWQAGQTYGICWAPD